MATEVVNRQRRVAIDRRRAAEVGNAALAVLGLAEAGVTVAFVRDPAIRRLNRLYRQKDRPTDVLSFPSGETGAATYLGDVVISTDTAMRQAEAAGMAFEREVSELIIHGILHLCGYDHERDRGEMNRLELRLRRKILG